VYQPHAPLGMLVLMCSLSSKKERSRKKASSLEELASREGIITSTACNEEELWSDVRIVSSADSP